ncbi:hypothetical protein FPCIR_10899 [Fusarium pseudocircinatum]|uniref:Heterokaryon incompatibility domain-containing protein n=1 Tax=Fusarium pseudocircinatum TaxID=56676 RepID=A0A8H5NVJ1_9HYPO|nr:hypothetical protein FPCIR_10899 [Fusarium pseudocircinatum]
MAQQHPYLTNYDLEGEHELEEPTCPNFEWFEPTNDIFPVVNQASGAAPGFHYMSVIENVQDCMKRTKLRHCTSPKCVEAERILSAVAPECEWEIFREWAIKVMACWSTSKKVDLEDLLGRPLKGKTIPRHIAATRIPMSLPMASFYIRHVGKKQHVTHPPIIAIYFCTRLLASLDQMHWSLDFGYHRAADFFGIVELLVWMASATDFVPHPRTMRKYVDIADDMDLPLYMTRLQTATYTMSHLKSNFCRRRLWNLVLACKSGVASAPPILSLLSKMPETDLRVHAECTPEACLFDDENTTTVRQLHPCGDPESNHPIKCDPFKLNSSTLLHNAWTMNRELTSDKFMAISHIWLDGTGSSIYTEAGNVNECAFDFFSSIAREQGCEGIWWDAICMPSDRKRRAEEINKMHQNYSQAEFTLVHDLQLTNFEWKDDGSPCLALALSAWFTRGWTALELRASKKVKVLFKAPEDQAVSAGVFEFRYNNQSRGRYVLKDLDEDILAGERSIFTHLAHQEVSLVIQTVRGQAQKDLTKLNQLMLAMKHRHTSWARDRMIITGLMAYSRGLGPDLTQAEITKRLLVEQIARITPHSLLHGNMTMCTSGPWSWCPPVLLDLAEDEEGYDSFLDITPDGELVGKWGVKTPTKEETTRLSPVGSHPSTVIRIKRYLALPEEILILDKRFVVRQRTMTDFVAHDRYLIVTQPGPQGRSRYIGVVSGEVDWSDRQDLDIIIG